MKSRRLVISILVGTVAIGLAYVIVTKVNPQENTGSANSIDSTATSKRADIKRLLDVTNAGMLHVEFTNQFIETTQKDNPKIPDKFWKEITADLTRDKLVELYVPSYDKRFTHDEIKQLITFYKKAPKAVGAEFQWGKKKLKTPSHLTLPILNSVYNSPSGKKLLDTEPVNVQKLIAFLDTPLGKKAIKTQPIIELEFKLAEQKWSEKIMKRIGREMVKHVDYYQEEPHKE